MTIDNRDLGLGDVPRLFRSIARRMARMDAMSDDDGGAIGDSALIVAAHATCQAAEHAIIHLARQVFVASYVEAYRETHRQVRLDLDS